MEEVYLFTQHIKGFKYSDVMEMPTHERRFFLGEKLKEMGKQEEHMENLKNQTTNGGKGVRTSTVSGEALKTRIKNGDIPIN